MKNQLAYTILILLFVAVVITFEFDQASQKAKQDATVTSQSQKKTQTEYKPKIETTTQSNNTVTQTKTSDYERTFSFDPMKLSFTSSSYYEKALLKGKLASSKLGYCSYVSETENGYILTWNLKSNNKEIYSCKYSYDKNREYDSQSSCKCRKSDGYDDYLNGDTRLIRDYTMPVPNDNIEIYAHEVRDYYYEKYFILGKFSDMYCYTKGDDIYCEYYWYQRTDNGPVLVYASSAKNNYTTWGQRYNNYLWDEFEKDVQNIDIIPYHEYPRTKNYSEVYMNWKYGSRKTEKDYYCAFDDPDDLYYEYEDDFDSYEEAEYYWEDNCQ